MNPVGPQPATTTKPIDLVVADPHSSIHPGPTNPANNVAPTQDAANGGGGGGGGIINPGVVKDEVSNAINHNSAPQNAPNGEPIVITQAPASQPQGIVPVFNNPGGGAHQPGGASGGASVGGVGSDQATVGMNPMIWMSAVGAAFGIVAGVFVIGLFTALRRKRSVAIDTEEGAKDATTAAAAAVPPKIPAVMSWIHRAPSLPAFWHRDDFFDDDSVRTGSGSGRSRTIASTHLSVSVVDQVVVGDDAEKGSEDMIQDVVYTEEMKEQELKRLHAVVQLQRARAENERVIQELMLQVQ
ncbi:hypothetical protein BDR26DRAFT_871993 [Obelidium mucronatum]|nr:hypothetical protein BDR26DRAFT_871993 [Obelidium mucronatum]